MNKGKQLQKGDTIGIVALSSALIDLTEIDRGIQYLENLGFKVKLASNVKVNKFFFPDTAEVRAKELMSFFEDPTIDMIMALRGGYGAIQVLEFIDFEIIKANPKIFVGFSDLTSLQQVLFQKANLINFSGPMLTSNFSKQDHSLITDESLFSLIKGQNTTIINRFNILYNAHKTKIEGRLLGGNLITFMSLMGTVYEPDLTDKILFFEDIEEKTYSIDRALTQLTLNKNFSKVKAIILGDFVDCVTRNEYEEELYPMIVNRLKKSNIPIINNIPAGHCSPNFTIPIGVKIEIDLQKQQIQLLESVVGG